MAICLPGTIDGAAEGQRRHGPPAAVNIGVGITSIKFEPKNGDRIESLFYVVSLVYLAEATFYRDFTFYLLVY